MACRLDQSDRISRTIKSPQVLELSGVGDRAVLERQGISVKLDLPSVGSNVQEHLFVGENTHGAC